MAILNLISCCILDTLTCGLLAGETRTVANHKHARPVDVAGLDSDRFRIDVRTEINGTPIASPSFIVRRTRTGYVVLSAQLYRISMEGSRIHAKAETLHFDAISPGHIRMIEACLSTAKTMQGLGLDSGPRTVGDFLI